MDYMADVLNPSAGSTMSETYTAEQMQEMAEQFERDTPLRLYQDVPAMLRQAASQAAEIERLTKENAELWEVGKRQQAEVMREMECRVANQDALRRQCPFIENCGCAIMSRHEWWDAFARERLAKEAAESRLLALREQIEGLPRIGWKQGEGMVYMQDGIFLKRADVLALFDPAQEKPLASDQEGNRA
jgi:hypothetical protein